MSLLPIHYFLFYNGLLTEIRPMSTIRFISSESLYKRGKMNLKYLEAKNDDAEDIDP